MNKYHTIRVEINDCVKYLTVDGRTSVVDIVSLVKQRHGNSYTSDDMSKRSFTSNEEVVLSSLDKDTVLADISDNGLLIISINSEYAPLSRRYWNVSKKVHVLPRRRT